MHCPACGQDSADQNRFCGNCGIPLPLTSDTSASEAPKSSSPPEASVHEASESSPTALTTAPQLLANLNLAPGQPSGSNVPQALWGPGLNSYLVRSDSGGTWTMLRDGLGSIAAVTTGSSTRNYAYSPFGASAGSGASSSNPYQFTGNQLDTSGLYYMNARYYSPVLQQFVSVDPLGVAGGNADVYAYAYNSPTNLTDKIGLQCGGGGGNGGPLPVGNAGGGLGSNGLPSTPGGGPLTVVGWGSYSFNVFKNANLTFEVAPPLSASPSIVLPVSQPVAPTSMPGY